VAPVKALQARRKSGWAFDRPSKQTKQVAQRKDRGTPPGRSPLFHRESDPRFLQGNSSRSCRPL